MLLLRRDVNEDGTLSKKEFRLAMASLGVDASGADFDETFRRFDPDGSGTVRAWDASRTASHAHAAPHLSLAPLLLPL